MDIEAFLTDYYRKKFPNWIFKHFVLDSKGKIVSCIMYDVNDERAKDGSKSSKV